MEDTTIQNETITDVIKKGNEVKDNSSEVVENENEELAKAYGMDLSDVPVEGRAKVIEKLKLAEQGISKKFQEVAKYKRIEKDLLEQGTTVEEINEAIKTFKERKSSGEIGQPVSVAAAKAEVKNTIDQLIDDAQDKQTRDSLVGLKNSIKHLAKEELSEGLRAVNARLDMMFGTVNQSISEKRVAELESLKEVYSEELVEELKNEVIREGVKYPQVKTEEILGHLIVQIKGGFSGLLKKPEQKKVLTPEKKASISGNSKTTITNTNEKVDVSKMSFADVARMSIKK